MVVLTATLIAVPTAAAHIAWPDGPECPDDGDLHVHRQSSGAVCVEAGLPEKVCVGDTCICRIHCPFFLEGFFSGMGRLATLLA